MRRRAAVLAAALPAALGGCSPAAPSWDSLIAAKITEQYPSYQVTLPEPGHLRVARPGLPERVVDVAPVAQFCQRGPRDCDYAVDQVLLALRP
jgi:hypothetical protein